MRINAAVTDPVIARGSAVIGAQEIGASHKSASARNFRPLPTASITTGCGTRPYCSARTGATRFFVDNYVSAVDNLAA